MAIEFREVPSAKIRSDAFIALGLSIVAFLVYVLTMSRGIYPGESAQLMATFSGFNPQPLPTHPVWGKLVSWVSQINILSLPLRLNLFSLICSVLCVPLIYKLVNFFIYETINEEYSVDYAAKTSSLAAIVAAVAFMFSAPIWHAATRLQYQNFEMLLVLIAASLLIGYAKSRRGWWLVLFSLLYGVCIVESSLFIPLLPVFIFATVVVLWKNRQISLPRVTWMALLMLVGTSLYYLCAKAFFKANDPTITGFATINDVVLALWKVQIKELTTGLPRVNWLILLIMSIIPWVTCTLAAPRALNNERSWSQYILHFTATVIVLLALANSTFSPWALLQPYGKLPVWAYAMLATMAGYLVAYWYLLLTVKRPKRNISTSVLVKRLGDWLGLIITYPLIALIALASLLNVVDCRGSRGDFADRCAKEILERLGERIWFVTDGTLDAHLAIQAHERGQELHLVCLQKDLNKRYLHEMAALIEEKELFPASELQRMQNTLSLGILPFLQDWFVMDREIDKKMAVFGVPDFWFTADMEPVPEYLFFGGKRDIKTINGKELFSDFTAFWQTMDKLLQQTQKRTRPDPTTGLRLYLRRHLGFVANNLGVLLEDLGLEAEAFKTYTTVHNTIDPHNVSAMFNRFEMARRGVAAASASKDVIEKELRDFVANLKGQYPLWSLSRYYGYVRSPELFARLGWSWALSGQTGAALKGLRTAANLLVSDAARANAMLSEAAIYSLSGDRTKTTAVYQDILKNDPSNRSAMLGLARIAVQDGAVDAARRWLEQAARSDDKRGALGVEWATIHLMNNDLAQARLILQETTDLQPQNLQAWAMLAMVNLQQDQTEEIDTVILPKMEKIAGTNDDYYYQITRALTMQRKGKSHERAARESFIRAASLRPDIMGVKDSILQLDISMNDQVNAELHARQVLRSDRKHALANYVLGSLRLQEGSYGEAEGFLRQSITTSPSAAAHNDLAETLRRIRKFDDAEAQARAACKLSPDLYIAWETLAAVLVDANRKLEEAEQSVRKSIQLEESDLRPHITLARILLKKGEVERARETIHMLRSRQKELPVFDQEELTKLAAEASARSN